MPRQLTVTFTPTEREILQTLAVLDLRYPQEQIRWLVRQEAERRGLWPASEYKKEEGGERVLA